jgi:ribonuclease R
MALNRPSVYRIHEAPKEKKLNDYREDVLSHRIPCGNLNHRPEVQKLLSKLDTLPIGPALKIGFLRSLMRARYAVEPLGHYGLAKTKYTHFTSPIRRYADLVVHRTLFEKTQHDLNSAKQIADHITTTEKNSADAERDSKDVKLYAFLKAQLDSKKPQQYAALVTEVRNFGFFVDVPNLGMSGGVPLSAIPDDFYMFDPASSQLIGRHTRRVIRLGDNVVVQIHKVDSVKKQVDFQLVVQRGEAPPSRKPERRERRERDRSEIKSAPPPKRGHGHKQSRKKRR